MSISFEKVSYEYSAGTPFSHLALDQIDLTLAEGKMTAIIGATGSGKSTLVQHLNALLVPSSGTVVVDEAKIIAGQKFKETKALRQKVGLVFQFPEYQLFEETLLKDVAFGPQNFGMAAEQAEQLAAVALKTVGISPEDFSKSPLYFPGGQKCRVSIAGILAMQPKLLVLDEPTAGLYPQCALAMMNLFRQLNQKQGITVVIVSHDMEYVLNYCDRIVVLADGKVLLHKDVKDFFASEEDMTKAHIDPPAVIKMRLLCQKNGLKVSNDAETVEELARQLAAVIKK